MITISTLSGEWAVLDSSWFGGLPFASNALYGIGFLFPVDSDSSVVHGSIKGYIETGFENEVGDKNCTHIEPHGLLVTDEKFSSIPFDNGIPGVVVNMVQKVTIPLVEGSITIYGDVHIGPGTVLSHFPDILNAGYYHNETYTNITLDYSFSGNVMTLYSRYTCTNSYGYVYDYERTRTWEVDMEGLRWRNLPYRTEPLGPWMSMPRLRDKLTYSQPPSYSLSKKAMFQKWDFASKGFPSNDDELIFGDLVRRCANDAQALDMNNIENIGQLSTTVRELKQILSLLKGKASLKSAAKLFLAYKYGVRLTVSDLLDAWAATAREIQYTSHFYRWVRASEGTGPTYSKYRPGVQTTLYNYKIYYDPRDSVVVNTIMNMWNTGLFPSLQSSWDLIPFSFVVDWFLQLGDSLDAHDARTFWSVANVISTLRSKKTVIEGLSAKDIMPELSNCSGSVSLSKYDRVSFATCMSPVYFSVSPHDFKNYAELTALLITRGKR